MSLSWHVHYYLSFFRVDSSRMPRLLTFALLPRIRQFQAACIGLILIRNTLGRPANHPNEFTLTRLCFARIMACANEDDLRWLRRNFSGFRNNPGRYRTGKRVFGWRTDNAMIHKLEARFPGSVKIFLGPVGQILLGRKLPTREIIDAIAALEDPYRTIILGRGYGSALTPRSTSRCLDDIFQELEQFVDFGTLQSIILLLSWADRIANHDTWNAACSFYRYMIPQFIFHEAFAHHEIIFDAVDEIALFRVFKANRRSDRRRSWRREMSKVKKLRKQVAIEIMRHWQRTSGESSTLAELDRG